MHSATMPTNAATVNSSLNPIKDIAPSPTAGGDSRASHGSAAPSPASVRGAAGA
jgi:hypothetical protein